MTFRRHGLAEDDHRGGHKRVCELHVRRAKAVNLEQGDALTQIAPDSGSVVHVHKLGRDAPHGKPILFHPIVGVQEEVAIQPGQTAD